MASNEKGRKMKRVTVSLPKLSKEYSVRCQGSCKGSCSCPKGHCRCQSETSSKSEKHLPSPNSTQFKNDDAVF